MAYPQIVEYNEAVQNPQHAFTDTELKRGSLRENALGLPLVLSGGFALTYTLETPHRKFAVRCFHREIPSLEQKYNAISKTLRTLGNGYFVNFDFQKSGIVVRRATFPIVKMDWVDGDTLGIWLDKNYRDGRALEAARKHFASLARFLEQTNIAHGDIQNGNVMMSNDRVQLIDYDGMFVPGMAAGNGSETGHKHFQHPERQASDFGPKMDRFSFIALDLSLQAVIADESLYPKFRDGGETIIFRANDFADPSNSEIFRVLMRKQNLKSGTQNFAAICEADLSAVPSLDDFLAGRNIPVVKPLQIKKGPTSKPAPQRAVYISAYPIVDALDFDAAFRKVGDRVELIGRIVEVKPGTGRRGRGRGKPYVFINFGPWKGKIVKISLWSEGLSKLKEQPSAAWVNRWISVVGLIDPPYTNTRYGYEHLSITVEQDGQLQFLEEAEARFRLASVGRTAAPRNREFVKGILQGSGSRSSAHASPQPSPVSTGGTRNTAIVNKIKTRGQSQTPGQRTTISSTKPTTRAPSTRPTTPAPSKGIFSDIPAWAWVAGAIVLYLLISSLRQSSEPTTRTAEHPPAARQAAEPATPKASKPLPQAAEPATPKAAEPAKPVAEPVETLPAKKGDRLPRDQIVIHPMPNDSGSAPTVPETGQNLEIPPYVEPLPPASEMTGSVKPTTPPIFEPPHQETAGPSISKDSVEGVRRIQLRLADLGYLSPSAVDGRWGKGSDAALRAFRQKARLGADAHWDRATEETLFSVTAPRQRRLFKRFPFWPLR